MRPLAIVLSVLIMVVHVKTEDMDILEDILVYPIPVPEVMNIQKRETGKYTSDNFNEFVEDKLTQHTQALEHIVRMMDKNEETNKQLIEFLSKTLQKPNLPEKVELEKTTQKIGRRSNSNNEEKENPLWRLGKNIPKYGRLAKDLFMKDIQSDTDPTPLVETNPDEPTTSESSRRSYGAPGIDPMQQIKDVPNPWCQVAVLCKKTAESICGFDDNYGYGKFDDICHMMHVNCYYRYNFVLVHTCHPTI